MFEKCKNLVNLDLSSFKTENVTKIHNMFSHCENLEKLNLSSFDINHINNGVAFIGCNKLKIIQINKMQIEKLEEFLNDSKIQQKIHFE